MKRILFFWGALLLFVTTVVPAFSTTVSVEYVGQLDNIVKSIYVGGRSTQWYAGRYEFLVDGNTWNSYCMDPFTEIGSHTWSAYYYSGNDIANYNPGDVPVRGNLYEYSASTEVALEKYRMMNYLYNTYGLTTGTDYVSRLSRANLSLALWEVAYDWTGNESSINFSSGGFRSYSAYGYANTWLQEAMNYRFEGNPLPNVYTPNPLDAGQEIFAPPSAVPEPGTILLLGSGMCSLAAYAKYRRRKKSLK